MRLRLSCVQWTWCVQPDARLLCKLANDDFLSDDSILTQLESGAYFGGGTNVRCFSSCLARAFFSVAHTRAHVIGRRFAASCDIILRRLADPFIDALRERWMAPALVAMRTERHLDDVLPGVRDACERQDATRLADITAHGLKHCALPSCDKQEVTVQQYKFCSACRSVWYCSAEHGALHWKEHKPACRATVAAKEAAEEVVAQE